jgi:hypothetical protein
MWVTLPAFHSSSPSTCIAGAVSEVHVGIFFISVSVRRFDYPTVLQHNTPTSPTSRDSEQARFTNTWLGNGYETNLSPLDILCSEWPVEHGSEVRPLRLNILYTWSIKSEFPFVYCSFQMPFFMVNCWVSTKSTKHRPCCVFLMRVVSLYWEMYPHVIQCPSPPPSR